MSWEETSRSERKCPCGKGKYVHISESDDWSRSRTKIEIHCPICQTKNAKAKSLIHSCEAKELELRKTAASHAKKGFLAEFLNRFSGKSKKAVWDELFEGAQSPALGTFYAHIRSSGSVESFLEKHFLRELESFFPAMFKDGTIESLLKRARMEKKRAEQTARIWAEYLPTEETGEGDGYAKRRRR